MRPTSAPENTSYSLSRQMDRKPGVRRRRLGSLAKKACLACRSLKARCDGADNPPCVRCSKVGRPCLVTALNHDSQTLATAPVVHSSNSANQVLHQYPFRHSTDPSLDSGSTTAVTSSSFTITSNLSLEPSPGPWSSALSILHSPSSRPELECDAAHFRRLQRPQDHGVRPMSYPNHVVACNSAPELPSDNELCHLCHFFVRELLVHVPILTELDVGDLAVTIKAKRPLAYSMAYVAARFVPGCKAIQSMLDPTILAIVRLQFAQPESSDEEPWTLLQALAVLYNWAPTQQSDFATNEGSLQVELRQEMLRASIETLSLRYSLHKSAEEIAGLLTCGANNIQHTFAFRKYMYWLWLFSLAHFRSLILETPPSMRVDATITWAPQLLDSMKHDVQVRRILARVELCLIWVRTDLHERHLREWWHEMPTQTDLNSILATHQDLEAALQIWNLTWGSPERHTHFDKAPNASRDITLDFYHKYSQCCTSKYAIKLYHSSRSTESLPLSMVNLVMKSAENASAFCHFFLDLTPLAKSSTRFSPEITFAMVAATCKHLIQVRSYLMDLSIVQPVYLIMVREVAELMTDLGVDDRHGAKVYGQSILAILDRRNQQKHDSSRVGSRPANIVSQEAYISSDLASSTGVNLSMRGTPGQLGMLSAAQQNFAISSSDGAGL